MNSMSDLFHEDVPIEFIAKVFDIMACATAACGKNHWHEEECWTGEPHTFQILTKRPERMMKVLSEELADYIGHYWPGDRPLCVAMFHGDWPLPNVWLGVSVENQQAADKRIPWLLRTPAVVRFVSCEPLLEQVDLQKYLPFLDLCPAHDYGDPGYPPIECPYCQKVRRVDWVIVSGESGPGARPMHPDWVRSLRDQCQDAGVPFFFKQWGEWAPVHELRCNEQGIRERQWYNFDPDTAVCRIGKKNSGRMLDGREWNEIPEWNGARQLVR